MFNHNLFRARPVQPGTSSPAPGRLPRARISQPWCSPGQSAPGRGGWRLQFEPAAPPKADPLTGWTVSTDPYAQVRLDFPTLQAAIAFAERMGWRYTVVETGSRPARPRYPAEAAATWSLELLADDHLSAAPPAAVENLPADPVELASRESFPASDSPSWTLGREPVSKGDSTGLTP